MRSQLSYSEHLVSPKWQKRRLYIMQRDGWQCAHCGENELQLEVHHIRYTPNQHPANSPDEDLITLCRDCHQKQHTPVVASIETMAYTRQQLIDKIKSCVNSFSKNTWMQAVFMIENEALKNYGIDLKEYK